MKKRISLDEFKKLSSSEMQQHINWVHAAENLEKAKKNPFILAYEEQKDREDSLVPRKKFDPNKLKYGPK